MKKFKIWYQSVPVAVDSGEKMAEVEAGFVDGELVSKDFRWFADDNGGVVMLW